MPESPTAAAAMGIESMWQYITKTEERFNGKTKTVCRCNFCNVVLGAANATRTEEHLSGLRLSQWQSGQSPEAVRRSACRTAVGPANEQGKIAQGEG